jgi:hypothetical protein
MTRRALENLPPDDDPLPHLRAVFQTLAFGKRSNNAFEAYRLGFLRLIRSNLLFYYLGSVS